MYPPKVAAPLQSSWLLAQAREVMCILNITHPMGDEKANATQPLSF